MNIYYYSVIEHIMYEEMNIRQVNRGLSKVVQNKGKYFFVCKDM
jgi:hypothetical protein